MLPDDIREVDLVLTEDISHKISYSKEKLPNCMHSKRDCSRCSNNDVCNFKTNKSSEELFIYDPITTIWIFMLFGVMRV